MRNYAGYDRADSDFPLLHGKWAKVNLFRNRVNVFRIRDNLFSITSPLDLGRLARPRTIPTYSLRTGVFTLCRFPVS